MRRLYIFLLSVTAGVALGAVFSFFFVSSLKAPVLTAEKSLSRILPLKIVETPTEKEPEVIPEPKPTTILAVGDIMLGRNVEQLMKKQGADYPFQSIKPFFDTFDFVFANLEGPIPVKHKPTPGGSTQFSFTKDTGTTLKRNSIDIVSLANNHTFDQGKTNFENTRLTLSEAGVLAVGSQMSSAAAYVVTTTIQNEPVTFMAFNDVYGIMNIAEAVKTVQQFAGNGSFVFVGVHWGDEYKLVGNKRQADIAHKLVDAGADVIMGQHPHVVQHIEMYKDKPIFYSLGNFIFDQYFSQNTQEGLAVGITFEKEQINYTLYPISIPKSQPTLMPDEAKTVWLGKLANRSAKELKDSILIGKITAKR